MINVGIIGTGFMTVAHLRVYAKVPGVRVAALCNPSGRNLDGDFSKVAGNVGDQSGRANASDSGWFAQEGRPAREFLIGAGGELDRPLST